MNLKLKAKIMEESEIKRAILRISHEILEKNRGPKDLALVGIQRRGVYLARRILKNIESIERQTTPLGILDITLYRDDLSLIDTHPQVRDTHLDFDVNKKKIVLVDDVLFTGRTVRCALDEIMDFGRPDRIYLAVLIDRGHRELPVKPDFVGKNIPTSKREHIEVKLKEIDGEDAVYIYEVAG